MSEQCSCGEIDFTKCQCSIIDTDCLRIDGSGSATNPFSVEGIFDPDEDNLASCSGDGLLIQLPSYILDPPRVSAYNSAAQSTTNDTSFVVALNSEYFDSGVMHDVASNNSRVTFTTAGVYVVTFRCSFAANATGDRAAHIRKNGYDFLGGEEKKAPSSSLESGHIVVVEEAFEVGEYVEAIVKQDSGGALNLLANRYSPILTAVFRRRSPY